MARPRLKIDPDQVIQLARLQCTMAEIAAVLKVSVDTLERRFAESIKRERENGQASLRRKQFQLAMEGHPTMLVWLGKQYLGQSDKQIFDQTITIDHQRVIEERAAEILQLVKPIKDSSGNEL